MTRNNSCDIKQCVVNLKDSDNNYIMAIVEYNTFYEGDFVVTNAIVEIKSSGVKLNIVNVDMLKAQYYDEIVKQLKEDNHDV